MTFLINLIVTVFFLAIASLAGLFLMAIAVFVYAVFAFPEEEKKKPIVYNDNLNKQSAYLVKKIMSANSEDDLWACAKQIKRFGDTFLDNPDIYNEMKELKEVLNERVEKVYQPQGRD